MNPDEVKAIEVREQAATPGPWVTNGPDADAEFIAHARADIPALVAEVRQLYADNILLLGEGDRLQRELERAVGAGPEDYDWDVLSRIDKLDECEAEATRLRSALADILVAVNADDKPWPMIGQVREIATRALLGKGAT